MFCVPFVTSLLGADILLSTSFTNASVNVYFFDTYKRLGFIAHIIATIILILFEYTLYYSVDFIVNLVLIAKLCVRLGLYCP
jgi:hypothetical protein